MFVFQVLFTGIQGIYALLMGGPSAKEGLSAKYEHTSKFTLASQRSFHITYERPMSIMIQIRPTGVTAISQYLVDAIGYICDS